jgi:cyclic pyranopterin phosphate synthase
MLTHADDEGRPRMVDIGDKAITKRRARARARVVFPPDVAARLRDSGAMTKKGPVFHTAIVAGVMAAKKTHELIPFCHPLGLDDCRVVIAFGEGDDVVIDCVAAIESKTGVEMEALTGATVAALTVYDMCKALSHEIVIEQTRLVGKTGGKRDFGSVEVPE